MKEYRPNKALRSGGFVAAMTSPTVLVIAALSLFPLFFTLYYSFTDFYFLSKTDPAFVDVDNYVSLFKNPYFVQSIWNTVKFMVLAVIFETLLGLLLALFVYNFKKGARALRTMILLPALMPPVTVALVWQIMLSNNYGIINELLSKFGIPVINWLQDVNTAFGAILVIDIWQYTPLAFLLIYATLQTVPVVQYEAAKIDGAGKLATFFKITLPNISSGLIMVLLMRIIDSFRLFDKVNILTKGGPANSTATITQFIYQQGVRGLKVGYASAASVIMTILVLLFAWTYIRRMIRQKDA